MPTTTISHAGAVSRLGWALSDGTRAQILLALRQAPGYPGELAEQLGVSRQVMSNQLACLRGCGLVTAETQGRRQRYRLVDQRLATSLGGLLELVLQVDPECCGPDGCDCS